LISDLPPVVDLPTMPLPLSKLPESTCLREGKMRPQRIVLVLWMALVAGCTWPNLGPPGPEWVQRHRAILHDPYPDADLGPEVVGGRPREFQKPLAEPVRNRYLYDEWWYRRR
jgi:hypothetical protein